jgi:hypothetical protein
VALAEERQRAGELLAENRRLAAEAAETGLDAWETVAFLRAELLDREAEVARLGAALAQARGYRGNACHGPAHRCTPSGCSPGRAVDGAHDTCMWTVCCAQKATALQKRCLSLRRRSLLVWQGCRGARRGRAPGARAHGRCGRRCRGSSVGAGGGACGRGSRPRSTQGGCTRPGRARCSQHRMSRLHGNKNSVMSRFDAHLPCTAIVNPAAHALRD